MKVHTSALHSEALSPIFMCQHMLSYVITYAIFVLYFKLVLDSKIFPKFRKNVKYFSRKFYHKELTVQDHHYECLCLLGPMYRFIYLFTYLFIYLL